MPIEWTAFPETRRVEATGSGKVSTKDWANYVETMRQAGVLGYAKLLDLSHATFDISAAEIAALARMVNTLADDSGEPLGPAAVVTSSTIALDRLILFDDRTATGHRQFAIFPDRQLAIDWLDNLIASR